MDEDDMKDLRRIIRLGRNWSIEAWLPTK